MSVILEFPDRTDLKPAQRNGGTTAEVIIFPGVRIERREFNIADRVARVRRRPAGSRHAEEFEQA